MEKAKKTRSSSVAEKESWVCCGIQVLLCIICVAPLIMVLSASLTAESTVVKEGYSLFIKDFSLDTYKFLLNNKARLLMDAFKMTVLSTFLGTICSVIVTTCFAWAVTQKKEDFFFARPLSFIAWFTTIFSGGVLPWYILCTQYYGLKNNIFALFVPSCFSVWNMYILRGNFRTIPTELLEAAKLDGASHARIFVQLVLPLGRAGIVAVSMFNMLGFWNDFFLPQWLINKTKYQTLQKLLYSMLSSTTFLMKNSAGTSGLAAHVVIPNKTAVMAVAVIAIIPILAIYPFTLRYFVKGINLGGVKG